MKKLVCALVFAWVGTQGCMMASSPVLVEENPDKAKSFIIQDVSVFTGNSVSILPHQDIWIDSGKIQKIGPTQGSYPAQIKVISGKSLTALPGLIDTHVHVTGLEAAPWKFFIPDQKHHLHAWLYAGITTVYDLGGPPKELEKVIRDIENQKTLGPRILHTHEPWTAPGGHPVPAIRSLLPPPMNWVMTKMVPQLENSNQVAEWVKKAKENHASFIKVIYDELPPGAPKLDFERLKAIVQSAHAERLKVMVHIGSNQDALDAVRAGADHLAHGVYKELISDALVKELKEKNVGVTYTAAGFNNTRMMAQGIYQPSLLAKKIVAPEILDSVTGGEGKRFSELEVLGKFSAGIISEENIIANLKKLHQAGVSLYLGSDSPIAAVYPGSSYHEEIELYQKAGISSAEILTMATSKAAKLIHSNPDFGSLEAGKSADLFLVEGSPTQNAQDLQKIKYLFVRGQQIDRK